MKRARISILIACEGKETEPHYFEHLKEQEECSSRYAVTVYPSREDRDHKTSALGLVKYLLEREEEFDELWAVFDKDGHTDLEEAFALADRPANSKRINIAFSSRSFEQWVLFHFSKSLHPFSKTACKVGKKEVGCGLTGLQPCIGEPCLVGHLRAEGYLPEYGKSGRYQLFQKIFHFVDRAVLNASWARTRLGASIGNRHLHNPYTDVDLLVAILLDLPQVCWIHTDGRVEKGSLGLSLDLSSESAVLNVHNQGSVAVARKEIALKKRDHSIGAEEYLEVGGGIFQPLEQHTIALGKLSRGQEPPLVEVNYKGVRYLWDDESWPLTKELDE